MPQEKDSTSSSSRPTGLLTPYPLPAMTRLRMKGLSHFRSVRPKDSGKAFTY